MTDMMPQVPMRIDISGFRSIENLSLQLETPVTVLVGANGAGKSNLISALELLGRIATGQLQQTLVTWGGIGSQLFMSHTHLAKTIQLGITSDSRGDAYTVTLEPAVDDTAVIYEKVSGKEFGPTRESTFVAMPSDTTITSLITGLRVFHFDDTSFDAPPRRRAHVADDISLSPDGGNLAAVLLHLSRYNPDVLTSIELAVRSVAPFFDTFVLEADGESILLRWKQKGLDRILSVSQMSSGTLRFAMLATLLLHPHSPRTIVLDEPELGLHPAAIWQLSELIRASARDHRVIVATQSVTLVNQFTIDEIVLVLRNDGATTAVRPNPDQFTDWLADYSLGELWEKNILFGGYPQVEREADTSVTAS